MPPETHEIITAGQPLAPAPDHAAALAGHWSVPIIPGRIEVLTAACIAAGVVYRYGGKARDLRAVPLDVSGIDCSGFSKWALYHATAGQVVMPDGSVNQNDWCQHKNLKRSAWESTGLHDGLWRLAFHRPGGSDGIGHVWFVKDGVTYESHGGRGPSHRAWDAHPLGSPHFCTDVYVLA